MVNQLQEKTNTKVFHPEDFILWHYDTGTRTLPLPGVVLQQRDEDVVIRVHLDGVAREITVKRDELVER